MFKSFVIGKKGYGNIEYRFYEAEDRYTMFINDVEVRLFSKEHCLESYKAYLADGWTLKPAKAEKKAAAPKQKQEKAERFIWGPETRKIWAVEYNRRKRLGIEAIKNLKGDEYRKARQELEVTLKAEMKVWEAENAAQVNLEVMQRRAEKDAING